MIAELRAGVQVRAKRSILCDGVTVHVGTIGEIREDDRGNALPFLVDFRSLRSVPCCEEDVELLTGGSRVSEPKRGVPFVAQVGEEPWVAWPGVLSEPTAFSKLIDDAKLARGLPYVVSDSKDVQVGQQCPVLGAFATEDLAARFIGTLPEYETGRYNLDGPADD